MCQGHPVCTRFSPTIKQTWYHSCGVLADSNPSDGDSESEEDSVVFHSSNDEDSEDTLDNSVLRRRVHNSK